MEKIRKRESMKVQTYYQNRTQDDARTDFLPDIGVQLKYIDYHKRCRNNRIINTIPKVKTHQLEWVKRRK